MKLTSEEVQHIADLSRLALSEDEVKKYQVELTSILNYIKVLDEINTDKVVLTSQVGGLIDVFRDDKVNNWDKKEVALALNQADLEGGNFKVKRVLQ